MVAWAVQKARRVAGRLDREADAAIDAVMDRHDEVVTTRLAGHPVLGEMAVEAAQDEQVSELTRQQLELAVTAAARRDEAFGTAVTELLARLQAVEHASGRVMAGPGSAVFTGAAHAMAKDGGIAIGQAGHVEIGRGEPGPFGVGAVRPLTVAGIPTAASGPSTSASAAAGGGSSFGAAGVGGENVVRSPDQYG